MYKFNNSGSGLFISGNCQNSENKSFETFYLFSDFSSRHNFTRKLCVKSINTINLSNTDCTLYTLQSFNYLINKSFKGALYFPPKVSLLNQD